VVSIGWFFFGIYRHVLQPLETDAEYARKIVEMEAVLKSCMWAAAAIAPAAGAGFAVVFFMASHKSVMLTASLAAGVIRLLLAVAASVTILRFVAVPTGWFLAWMGMFYVITLVAEVYYTILTMNRQKE
jgi:hypothetical protein